MKAFVAHVHPGGEVKLKGELVIREDDTLVLLGAFTLAHLKPQLSITTPPGKLVQIFAREVGGELWLSNQAHLLLRDGETVDVKTGVLLQNLAGDNHPLNNYFSDIHELDASTRYIGISCKRAGSTISATDNAHPDDFINALLAKTANAGHASVMLSGGWDSRLNLALAKHHRRETVAYHDALSGSETAIAEELARRTGTPFVVLPRDKLAATAADLARDDGFALSLGSGYRSNIPRWYAFVASIQRENPSTEVLGMGAEGHKGKYYQQASGAGDLARIIGFRPSPSEAQLLGAKTFHDFHADAFRVWTEEAQSIFPSTEGQIDLVHYHANVCQRFAARTHLFHLQAGLDFPILDDAILSAVFNLPRHQKEAAALVEYAVRKLAPEIADVPVISGNAAAMVKRPSARTMLKRFIKSLRRRKRSAVALTGGSSQLTRNIERHADRFRSAARVHRYLTMIEARYGCEFNLL